MIPRGKIDISYTDLLRGVWYCIHDIFKLPSFSHLPEQADQLICLSVRTGFDLLLSALNFPPGSEIIVSNISIPDMFSIIEAHQLVPVTVSIDKHSLNVSASEINKAITPYTKAIIITHLFGAITNMDDVIKLAEKHNLIVIEDGAQAYAGINYIGHQKTDVLMQSFGLIKTNTSVSGAILIFKNAELAQLIKSLNNQLPQQDTSVYCNKLLKAFFIRLLTTRWVYTCVYYLLKIQKKDIDNVLSGFTRGFPGKNVLTKIRFRPCNAIVRSVTYRIAHYKLSSLEKEANLLKISFSRSR